MTCSCEEVDVWTLTAAPGGFVSIFIILSFHAVLSQKATGQRRQGEACQGLAALCLSVCDVGKGDTHAHPCSCILACRQGPVPGQVVRHPALGVWATHCLCRMASAWHGCALGSTFPW